MTVSTTSISKATSGNGSATSFPYDYKILEASDLQVIIRSATGAETIKATSTYTVTGVGADSGTIVFNNSNIPISGETVVVTRNVLQTQAIDYIANDPFPAETHEEGLDRATMVIQQVSGDADRSLKISKTNTMNSTEFTVGPADRANKVLSFNSSGELAVTQELGTFKGNSATTTTAAYAIRDIVKSTTAAQLNNIYICIQASPIGTALTNTAYWTLIVDAVNAAASAATATAKAAEAVTAKNAAVVAQNASVAAKDLSVTAKNESVTAKNESVTAKNAAETAQAAAEASFDSFDDRYLGAKSSNPSTDNDGNSLITGAIYFNSSSNQIFSWTGSAWTAIKPTSSEQTNINVLSASAVVADMAILGTTDVAADMAILGTNDVVSDMAILATSDIVTDMNVLGTSANVTAMGLLGTSAVVADLAILGTTDVVADMAILATNDVVTDMNVLGKSDVVADMNTLGTAAIVADMAILGTNDVVADMAILATNDVVADMNLLGTSTVVGNMNLLGTSTVVGNMATVVNNLASVNNFGEVYRVASSAPSSSLNSGDLYFNTSTNVLNVYGASGWQNAGSSVNGTTARFKFVASGTPTTFSGNDANGNSLSYDAGFIDVYLNGIKMVNGTDVTVTSGSAIVFASAVTSGDIIEAIAFGTFAVANLNASSLSSGTIPNARYGTPTFSGANLTNLDASDLASGTVPTARLSGAYTGITSLGTITSFRSTGIDDNADALAMTITSAENIGIGTANPTALSNYTSVVANNSSGSMFELMVGGTRTANIQTSSSLANIQTRTNIPIAFDINSSEKMRIDSSGNLLVGMTSNGVHNSGIGLVPNGISHFYTGGNRALELGRGASDGEILRFNRSGTTIGSISAAGGDLLLGTNNLGIRFYDSINAVVPINIGNSSNENNTKDLGNSGVRWRDIYLGGGAYLGGTGTANKLDDYEEGTFTPSIASNAGYSSVGYGDQLGSYTKIGNFVYYRFRLNITSGSTNGNRIEVSGLPFTSASSPDIGSGASFSYAPPGIVGSVTTNLPTLWHASNNSKLSWYNTNGGSFVGSNLSSATIDFYINGVYQTA